MITLYRCWRGDEVVATWEREQQLDGFARRLSRTRGGRLALQLKGQVERALDNGVVQLGYSSQWWPVISGAFGPATLVLASDDSYGDGWSTPGGKSDVRSLS